ncbi:MAG: major capsid protein [Pseudomonadota bacterium]
MKRNTKRALAALGTALPTLSFADVPTNVSTAITSAGTDAAAAAGLVLVAIVGIFAVKLIRKGL